MVFSLKKWIARGKFLVLFVVCTFILYHLFHFISSWIQPAQRYKEPIGKAVKVFQQDSYQERQTSMVDRLIFFYWYGE